MNKAYFIAPLLATVVFGFFYMGFSKDYKAKEQAKIEAAKQEKAEQLRKEALAREAAVKEALVAQEKRKKERAEKEAKDIAEKEARQAAIDARDRTYRDQEKLAKQVDRLTKEVEAEKAAIAKIEEDKKKSQDEAAFLRTYVGKAESNAKNLTGVLEKISAADAARAAAEAAAAAAAKAAASGKKS